ncbi:MAG TPA: GatB/YqeY domain-containing protein [Patescibacteria group bacterium]|nr:GatB/YqeY domain-containing protein [Patescibacteria group bacterium]
MTLKERLRADTNEAMRAGDTSRRDVLRMMLAAVKQEEVDGQKELDDEGVQSVLMKQAKQHRETISDAEKANRPDLVAKEEAELLIIDEFLPGQLSEEEVRAAASVTIDELGANEMQDMGRVMGQLMPRLKGQADGSMVSQIVRELLQT